MTGIDGLDGAKASEIFGCFRTGLAEKAQKLSAEDGLPPAASAADPAAAKGELPVLPVSLGAVSIENLMNAIAEEERKNNVQLAVNDLENKANEVEKQNAEKLEQIEKQLEEAKNQSFWQKFVKAFKIIGMVIGAVAAVATTVAGIASGNPLMIAAGITAGLMAIDSLVSTASDGKYSIAAGFQALGEKLGMSEDAAKWLGFGVSMAMMLTTTVLSFGAAASTSAAQISTALAELTSTTNVISGLTGIGSGIGEAGLAVSNYKLSSLEANKVDIEAVLEKLRNAIEMSEDLIEAQLETSNKLLTGVKDIIDGCGETSTAILTGSPAVA